MTEPARGEENIYHERRQTSADTEIVNDEFTDIEGTDVRVSNTKYPDIDTDKDEARNTKTGDEGGVSREEEVSKKTRYVQRVAPRETTRRAIESFTTFTINFSDPDDDMFIQVNKARKKGSSVLCSRFRKIRKESRTRGRA